ncbi:EscU/YscU/HrcU family type III secretion system export apparatus switch protein [Sphingomonas lenta]|uniref:Flagellar biosynthesis protein FlhB n=1 Tax=Sphingomonas lenta TaxID=1141887 RepID=A0A2A2SFB9_9SPHN|nr:flagellar type III secretion system protein FlhB [Sphingomonas lenta]PAX07928.1 flagellar biosynthesis protein FlhB [Sphingomonas lenta]
MSEGGDRTEVPTQKRVRDAVEKGDILKSREFATALVMMAGVGWIALFGPSLMAACKGVMTASLQFGRADVEDFSPWRPLAEAGWRLLPALGSLFAVSIAAAVASQAGLGSLGWNAKLLAPKGNRINPLSGLKRMFGMNGWIELGKSLLKVVLLGAIGWWTLSGIVDTTRGLSSSELTQAVDALGGMLTGVLVAMAFGLVLIAGFDVPLSAIRRMMKLRMTKQEVKDEHKQTEGSPEAKAHQRQRRYEILRGGARKAVAEAHVVLTNPTHFSVALRYDRGRDQVPVVVAKGRGATALSIREIAKEAAVPVLEAPALARAVYYTSREGQEVRDDLYLAIATVLAFVFQLDEAAGGGAALPPIEVPPTARFDENGTPH